MPLVTIGNVSSIQIFSENGDRRLDLDGWTEDGCAVVQVDGDCVVVGNSSNDSRLFSNDGKHPGDDDWQGAGSPGASNGGTC